MSDDASTEEFEDMIDDGEADPALGWDLPDENSGADPEREESLEELLERQLLVEEGALDENEEDFDG
jgi:hypothetical protein